MRTTERLWRAVRMAPATLASVTVLLGLIATGYLLWLVAPRMPSSSSVELANQILTFLPETIQPKPRVQFVYLGLILATPVLVALTAKVFSRHPIRNLGVADAAVILAGLGVATAIFVHDPLIAPLMAGKPALLAAAPLGLILASLEGKADEALLSRLKLGLLILLGLAAVGLPFAWRITNAVGATETMQSMHLGAFLYSIVQIYHGASCTVDLPTQYGCYGEFYLPVLKIIGLSVGKITIINAAILSISLISGLLFCYRLIKSPLIFLASGLCLLAITNYIIVPGSPDPYFQYAPLRLLFAALSLPLALLWSEHPKLRAASLLGVFGGLAVLWNTDSGIPVFGALGLLTLFGRPGPSAKAIKSAALYLLAGCGTLAVAAALLSMHGHGMADPMSLVRYARIFSVAGFAMLPTPAPPSAWTIAVSVAGIALATAALKRFRGQSEPKDVVAAYIAILGIGLLSYYLGRSHPATLAACVWPLVILFFVLLDGPTVRDAAAPARTIDVVCRAMAFTACIGVGAALAASWPTLTNTTQKRWTTIHHPNLKAPISRELEFIRKEAAGQRFDVFAVNQALIHAETSTWATLPGPGLDELLLKSDAARDIDFLERRGPAHFFVEEASLNHQTATFETSPWLLPALSQLRRVYALKNWSPDGSLLHLVRKPYAGPDLFDWQAPKSSFGAGRPATNYLVRDTSSGLMVTTWGRPIDRALDWIAQPSSKFSVVMKATPALIQSANAALISTHGGAYRGVVIYAMPGSKSWLLGAGDGGRWVNSMPFDIPAARSTEVALHYSAQSISVTVGGHPAATLTAEPGTSFVPGVLPLTLGDWIDHNRAFSGVIEEAAYFDESPSPKVGKTK